MLPNTVVNLMHLCKLPNYVHMYFGKAYFYYRVKMVMEVMVCFKIQLFDSGTYYYFFFSLFSICMCRVVVVALPTWILSMW